MGLVDIVVGAGITIAAEELFFVPERVRDAESRGFRIGGMSKENELKPIIERQESDNAALRKELARLNSETKKQLEAKDREIAELRQALTAMNVQVARLQEKESEQIQKFS